MLRVKKVKNGLRWLHNNALFNKSLFLMKTVFIVFNVYDNSCTVIEKNIWEWSSRVVQGLKQIRKETMKFLESF